MKEGLQHCSGDTTRYDGVAYYRILMPKDNKWKTVSMGYALNHFINEKGVKDEEVDMWLESHEATDIYALPSHVQHCLVEMLEQRGIS